MTRIARRTNHGIGMRATRRLIYACVVLYLQDIYYSRVAAGATHDVVVDVQQSLTRPTIESRATDDTNQDEGLAAWAARVASQHESGNDQRYTKERSFTGTAVVIGVKTNVVHNFAARQAIRQTWAHEERLVPFGVRVVFLGCESDLSSHRKASERVELQRAIAMEKRVFGDLLTSELNCVDSYFTLVEKATSYMQWLTEVVLPQSPSLSYVVVADDDVYVRVNRLVRLLMDENTPRAKFYGGYVWAGGPLTRDLSHKNHVSERDYPMAASPPFAGGPFYILSTDLAQFVARNREDLRGLGANDDLSIALWLLAMQVHPIHIDEMSILRLMPCQTDVLVVADALPSAIRYLHENEANNRPFCDGFMGSEAMRRHRSIILPHSLDGDFLSADLTDAGSTLAWKLQHHVVSNTLNIRVTVSAGANTVDYPYVPALERYQDALCARGATALQAKLYLYVDDFFCQFHRRALSKFLDETVADDANMRALLTLARHNLKRKTAEDVKVVALSRGARYARVLIECLFVEMYPNATILVLSDVDPREAPPDVFVFSVLDGVGRDVSTDEYAKTFGSDTKLVMISGEAWPIDKLGSRVVLISTVETGDHSKSLYIPVASTVFAESIQHSPLELLQPSSAGDRACDNRRFCAYLYARCDRIRREFMFDLLNAIEPVDALGACQGTGKKPQAERRRARYDKPFYTDDAIALYRNYRFVIAFENTFDAVGYVTEKIVTAFLAGAVPIYYGHNASVKRLFNPRAFINCGDFESLPACAEFVSRVQKSPDMYDAMRKERPVVNSTAFFESFSWHPDVVEWGYQQTSSIGKSVAMSIRLRQLIEP